MLDKIFGKRTKVLLGRFDQKKSGEMNPSRDWKAILLLFVVFTIFVSLFNFFIFMKIKSGEIFKHDSSYEIQALNLNKELLDEVIEFFDHKESRLQELRGEGNPAIIPAEEEVGDQEDAEIDQEL
jgi:hypothetical protein